MYSRAFDVFIPIGRGKVREIDTVFYSPNTNVDVEEVRRSLINHDGYDWNIIVRERRPKNDQ